MTTDERDYWLKEFVSLVEPEWIAPHVDALRSDDPYRQLAALRAIFSRLGSDTEDDGHRWN
jgi:hypothetical protein